jgi:uncharacterized membrane protein
MIKLIGSLYDLEGFFAMALTTILTELVIMWIFMTACTISVCHSGELLEFLSPRRIDFMTFNTVNTLVFTGKLKFSIIVIEL